jgi:hypothetical protein
MRNCISVIGRGQQRCDLNPPLSGTGGLRTRVGRERHNIAAVRAGWLLRRSRAREGRAEAQRNRGAKHVTSQAGRILVAITANVLPALRDWIWH